MRILTDSIQASLPPCVATIGCFDGVHRGHRYLVEQVCDTARKRGLHAALITFPVHPRQVMQSDYQPQLLSCLPQKTELIHKLEADYCLMLPFTLELSRLSAQAFMQLLHERFNVQVLLIGYDHRFGHDRREGFEDYCRYGHALGMEVIQAYALTEEGISISSSIIRRLLREGNIDRANHFLGYNYYLDGTVIDGYKVGRKLGFPTANLQPSCTDKLIPAEGVYAVRVSVRDRQYAGMLNIGRRPTVNNGTNRSIEAHLLHFSGDLYHQQIRIEFVRHIRSEQKFDTLDALIAQLHKDREAVTAIFQD